MKVIIAGSRDIDCLYFVSKTIKESNFQITEVVSGCARGVDLLGEQYAKDNALPIKRFSADWSRGKRAGFVRNQQMADYGEALIAIPYGSSPGTRDMIKRAEKVGLLIFVKEYIT